MNPTHPQVDLDPRDYRRRTFTALRPSARLRLARLFRGLKVTLAAPVPVGAIGGDVSKWQETVDWTKVKAGTPAQGAPGWEFVFVRWLFGLSVDVKAATHWAGAGGVGLKRGAYAYYLDALDPYQQAQKLFTVLSDVGLGELPPVGDFEEIGNVQLTPAKVKDYLEALTGFFGKLPILYTGSPVWKKYFQNALWTQVYPLWLAQYTLIGWQADHVNKVRNYPPTPPAPWFFWNEDTEGAPGEQAAWQFTASCPAYLYGVSGTTVDLDFASPWFWAKYGGGPPPPDPVPEGEITLQFKALNTFNIRSSPASLPTNDVGDLPKDAVITALEVRPTDNNSVWVRFEPNPAWITKTVPEYWAAMVHDGQGPLLAFHAAVPCPEGFPMTEEQLQRLTAVEAKTAEHETEIIALQNTPPGDEVFVPTHRVVTTKPGGEKLRAWPGGSEAVQVYTGLEAMILNQFRGGQELMAVKKSGIVITGWLDPGNITPL